MKAHEHGNETPCYSSPLATPSTRKKKKITLVCEQNINLAGVTPCVACTTKFWFFTTESLALSLFQLNAGGGDQAIPSSMFRLQRVNGSSGAGGAANSPPANHNRVGRPRAGGKWEKGQWFA